MEAEKEMLENLENKTLRFSTKQKGYGRQGLYANEIYIMDVFPNIEEHFNITPINDAFYNEETETYTNGAGRKIEEDSIYEDIDVWLCENIKEKITEAFDIYYQED